MMGIAMLLQSLGVDPQVFGELIRGLQSKVENFDRRMTSMQEDINQMKAMINYLYDEKNSNDRAA